MKASEVASGLSKAAAERNLVVQERGDQIVGQLQAKQGEDFAGIWFDPGSGEFVVPLADPNQGAAIRSAFRSADLINNYRTSSAANTWSDLEAAQSRLNRELAPLLTAGLIQTSLDPRTNSVAIDTAEGAGPAEQATIERAAASAAVAVDIRVRAVNQFHARSYACNFKEASCDKPPTAGIFIEPAGELAGTLSCSAGFKALGPTGIRYMLTAGHCYQKSADWRAWDSSLNPHYLGHADLGFFPGHDYARIQVSGYGKWWEEGISSWPSTIIDWSSGSRGPIETESASYVGEIVCHSGFGSNDVGAGTTCGPVRTLNKSVSFANEGGAIVEHLTEVNGAPWQVWPGDSGGPVWAGNSAVGLVSGGTQEVQVGYYQEVTEATQALGVSVGTRLTPPPTTETGNATGAGAKEVTVTGTVNPNGTTTSYHFEYGTTTSYGSSTATIGVGYGKVPVQVSATVKGLPEDATIHYRLVASSSQGTSAGFDAEVATLPGSQASNWGVRDKRSASQWAWYRAILNSTVCLWAFNPTSGFSSNCPTGQAAAATSIPSVLRNEITGSQWAWYTGSSAKVCLYSFDPVSGFTNSCPSGQAPATGTSPSAVRDPDGSQWAWYSGSNSKICLYAFNPVSGFSNYCPEGQAPTAASSPGVVRDIAGTHDQYGSQWAWYVGTNSNICLTAFNPTSGFSNNCLEGQAPTADTSPSVLRDAPSGSQWAWYTGTNSKICLYAFNPVSGFSNYCPEGQAPALGASPSAVRDPDGSQWAWYAGSNGKMCLYAFNPSSGFSNYCPEGQAPATGTRRPAVIRNRQTGSQWAWYIGSNSKVCLFSFDPVAGFSNNCPSGGQNAS